MTKNILLFVLLGFVSHQLNAQCNESQAIEYLHGNEVKAAFRNGGDQFWDGSAVQYAVPYTQGQNPLHTIFAGALWMGGYDQGGTLKLAAQTYRSSGNDYWAGPLDHTGTPISCTNYDKIWKVSGAAVRALILDFEDDGVVSNNPDATLLAWPGKGNPHFFSSNGFALPAQDLAPFADKNNDGIYNPWDGDYPIADEDHPTVIADEILWMVFNDKGNVHTQTNGTALGAEVHLTAYAFHCTGSDLINRTIFTKYKIFNKGSLSLYQFKVGLWTDFDLGCGADDFIGTIPSMNTVYAYNQDNNDDVSCGSLSSGYGVNPPVQALTLLNRSLDASAYYINSSWDPKGGPSSTLGYYRYLSGFWPNGYKQTAGGDGYNPSNPNAPNAVFIFPDNPNDASGWSMTTGNLSGLDTRSLAIVSPGIFYPGPQNAIELDVAYSYHRDLDSNNLQNVNLMYQQIPLVQHFYDNGYDNGTCSYVLGTAEMPNLEAAVGIKVYPNPTHQTFFVEAEEGVIETIELLNVLGQSVKTISGQGQQVECSVEGLAKGVYWLKVEQKGKTWTQKIQITD